MERLTSFNGGIWGMSMMAIANGYDKYSIFSKLAEYEDANLSPSETASLQTQLDESNQVIELIKLDKTLLLKLNKEFREEILRLREDVEHFANLGDHIDNERRGLSGELTQWKNEAIKATAELREIKLKFPCAVGDTVYDIDFKRPLPYTVTGFSYGNINEEDDDDDCMCDEIRVYCSANSILQSFVVSEIGKTIFLTREEAREALKKGSTPE